MRGRARAPASGQRRFRPKATKGRGRLWAGLAAVLFLLAAVYGMYSAVDPSQSFNPLWREVTIGQTVIGDWRYGGQDEEGYLKFYHDGETVVLPPSARVLDLDGRFVVLEGHSASTLSFAYPLAAIPLPWLMGILIAVAGCVGFVWHRRRALRRRRWQSSRSLASGLSRRRVVAVVSQPTAPFFPAPGRRWRRPSRWVYAAKGLARRLRRGRRARRFRPRPLRGRR
ncbi:hypothetical protein [Alicyclobacillus shizuokensis]|uniref:hypothetical protein n=1 Tax=Alicyclobacillus shizuokensis TaxID=392014 RepID=UPI0008376DB9|nr:hypothetical protein [Alicyclobacillus shizuokensis]MCL6626740.1 hypothetical protein [Alicyclobacillus shizuokensis]